MLLRPNFFRRRPLMQATMIGGTGFAAGQAAARRSAPAPPTRAGEADLVTQLKDLARLRDKGSLSPEEFAAAKTKLLAG
jgi:putative oligomerization/nucleic acid binding protein